MALETNERAQGYTPDRLTQVPEPSRLAIVAALEALTAGDDAYAEEILLSALEDGEQPRLLCPECQLDCRWPGRLDDHRRQVHRVAA